MKILSWNTRQGGGSRIDRIQNMIMAHHPEILVLSEFRNNAAGANLRQWLDGFGHQHQAIPETAEPRNYTVLVSSGSAFPRITFPELELNAHRCVGARFNGLTLLGLYFPIMEAKRPVFAFLKALAGEYLKKESLIIGDLNTICRYWDEGRMDLSLVEEFGALIGCGWTDVWRMLREWSWVERWGQHIGYRIDHALVSPPLVSRVQDVQYSHVERASGISDHSALILTLNVLL